MPCCSLLLTGRSIALPPSHPYSLMSPHPIHSCPLPPSLQVVLTGAKKREDIYRAFENIYPVLQTFRKGGECGGCGVGQGGG